MHVVLLDTMRLSNVPTIGLHAFRLIVYNTNALLIERNDENYIHVVKLTKSQTKREVYTLNCIPFSDIPKNLICNLPLNRL